ncbi:hypothetical protein LDENG_00231690, partial [Lucifuga dentata]
MEVWKVGKTFLIHHSSSMLWEMIVSDVTCMKTEYIRLKRAKWVVWSFKSDHKNVKLFVGGEQACAAAHANDLLHSNRNTLLPSDAVFLCVCVILQCCDKFILHAAKNHTHTHTHAHT